MSAVLLRFNEIFRRAVNREAERRVGSERFDAARQFGMRIFDDKVDMRLFVYVVEKRERGCKNKNANRSQQAEATNRPTQFLFG